MINDNLFYELPENLSEYLDLPKCTNYIIKNECIIEFYVYITSDESNHLGMFFNGYDPKMEVDLTKISKDDHAGFLAALKKTCCESYSDEMEEAKDIIREMDWYWMDFPDMVWNSGMPTFSSQDEFKAYLIDEIDEAIIAAEWIYNSVEAAYMCILGNI